jgi:hypothetical protein
MHKAWMSWSWRRTGSDGETSHRKSSEHTHAVRNKTASWTVSGSDGDRKKAIASQLNLTSLPPLNPPSPARFLPRQVNGIYSTEVPPKKLGTRVGNTRAQYP